MIWSEKWARGAFMLALRRKPTYPNILRPVVSFSPKAWAFETAALYCTEIAPSGRLQRPPPTRASQDRAPREAGWLTGTSLKRTQKTREKSSHKNLLKQTPSAQGFRYDLIITPRCSLFGPSSQQGRLRQDRQGRCHIPENSRQLQKQVPWSVAVGKPVKYGHTEEWGKNSSFPIGVIGKRGLWVFNLIAFGVLTWLRTGQSAN